ncbi:hypothetical protein [Bacillus cereus group sp. BceL212]|uniref:hypothetical protein n=1 Tax=Bacillus cereus group sp. BceL212 TaxID=3445018 RepID=UPI0033041C0B|nr:hypothetical protein [Bacillus cereus]
MIEQTFASYLNERGRKAFYPKPMIGETFIKGTVISIDEKLILIRDIDKTKYWGDYRRYLNRLKE